MAPIQKLETETVQVPVSLLEEMQSKMLSLETDLETQKGITAGLAEINSKSDGDENKLRTKKNYEPKFRTVRLRKYPVAGNFDDQDYVVGWTSRGAYRDVEINGVFKEVVDYIDVIFLRNKDKNKAEKIKLLDLLNNGTQEVCKVLEIRKDKKSVPTGEEIDVTTWDPQHGLTSTGEKVDGITEYSNNEYLVKISGIEEPVLINEKFINN